MPKTDAQSLVVSVHAEPTQGLYSKESDLAQKRSVATSGFWARRVSLWNNTNDVGQPESSNMIYGVGFETAAM